MPAYEAASPTYSAQSGSGSSPGAITFSGTQIPSGTGTGFLAFIFWANADDEPVIYDPAVWTFLGDTAGGAGSWGTDDQGRRNISAYFTTQDITGTSQTFTNGGGNDLGNLILGLIIRSTKTLTYWANPEVAEASDSVGGSGYSGTFNRNPGATAGDAVYYATIANTDSIASYPITLAWPGLGSIVNTGILTTSSAHGHDSRLNTSRLGSGFTGTATGVPTISSTTDFTGCSLLVRLRDTNTQPVIMDAGTDQNDVEPFTTVELDSGLSTGLSGGRTWTQQSGPTVTMTGATSTVMSFEAPGTLAGATLVFRVADDGNASNYDEVSVTVLPASRRVKIGGVMVPVKRRFTLP